MKMFWMNLMLVHIKVIVLKFVYSEKGTSTLYKVVKYSQTFFCPGSALAPGILFENFLSWDSVRPQVCEVDLSMMRAKLVERAGVPAVKVVPLLTDRPPM